MLRQLLLLCGAFWTPSRLWAAPEDLAAPGIWAWGFFAAGLALGLGVMWFLGRRKRAPLSSAQPGLLEGLFNHSGLLIYTKDRRGLLLAANQAFCDWHGRPADQLIGHKVSERLGPESAAQIDEEDRLVMESGQERIFRETIDWHGKQRHFETRKFPLFDDQGRVNGLCGMAAEVTEQVALSESLQKSEASFRQLFERHGSMFWLVDPDTLRIVQANAACAEFHGETPESMQGRLLSDFSTLDPTKARQRIRSIFEEGRARFLSPHVLTDGRTRTVEVHSSPVEFGGQELVFSVMHDMTDQIQAQQRLKEEEARFHLLSDAAFEPILIVDEGEVVEANGAAERHFQTQREELVGQKVHQLLPQLGELKPGEQQTLTGLGEQGAYHWRITCSELPFQERKHRILTLNDRSTLERQQEQLLENHRLLQAVIDTVPAPLFLVDQDGRLNKANLAFFLLTGQEAKQAQNHPLEDLIAPDLAQRFCRQLKAERDFDLELTDQQGERRQFSCSQAPLKDRQGAPRGTVSVLFDVTAREAAMTRLKETREQMDRVLLGSQDGYWELDLEQNRLFLSPLSEVLLGAAKDRTGADWGLPTEAELELRQKINDLLGSDALELEHLIRSTQPEGLERWLLVKGRVHHQAGRPRFLSGVVSDLSQFKRTEAELAEHKQRLDLAIEAGQLGFWDWYPPSDHLVVNQRWAEMLGYEPGEFPATGIFWLERLHPGDQAQAKELLNRLQQADQDRFRMRARMVRKEGNQIWTLTQGQVVERSESGEPLRLVGTQMDITEEVQINEGLAAAKAQAEEAARAKAEFLANMSHEIRTPMNAVLGFTELLRNQVSDPLGRSYLSAIQQGGKNLLRLINDLLDLSKLEASKLVLRSEPTDLIRLFEEVIEIFSSRAEQKGLNLELQLGEEVPRIVALDELRLRQVLFNLLGNAVKFTEQGQVSVEVQVSNLDPTLLRCDLLVSVSDSGIGIQPDRFEQLFDLFTYNSRQTTEGVGLGLPITDRLVRAMGGHIEVQSQPGQGSRFRIFLPKVMLVKKMQRPQDAEAASLPEPGQFQGTLLVVDDVESNRALVREALRNSDLMLREAEDGEQAVVLAEALLPDLILMDLRMPILGGVEATARLKGSTLSRQIPVVAMTASVLTPERYLKDGLFDAVLHKPLRLSELYGLLGRFLKPKALRPKIEPAPQAEPTPNGAMEQALWQSLSEEYEATQSSQNFEQIAQFAARLKDLGEQTSHKELAELGERLLFLTGNYDIEKLSLALNEFETLRPDRLEIK